MAHQLTRGAIGRIKNNGEKMDIITLQVITIKALQGQQNPGGSARYRIFVSDGIEQMAAMPATQLNHLFIDGVVVENSIVSISQYQLNQVSGNPILIVLAMEFVAHHPGPIGNVAAANQPANTQPVASAPQVKSYQPAQVQAVQPPSYGASSFGAKPPTSPYGSNAGPFGTNAQPYGNTSAAPGYGSTGGGFNAANNPYSSYGTANKPVIRDDASTGAIVPISAINPYSNKWTIKARVTAKSEKRHWSNQKGEGTLFSIDLLDSNGGEIRATFFKEACEKFFPIIEEGKVYTFSGGTLKVNNNRQYSNIKNSYELTFNIQSEIRAVADDNAIKNVSYNFIRIDQINNSEVNSTIDVIGIVRSASDPSEIVSTKMGGKTLTKRDVTLVDQSGSEIRLTLWGDKAVADYQWDSKPIAAFKSVRVGDYGGRSLSSSNNTTITVNPQVKEGFELHQYRSQFPDGNIPIGASLSASSGGAGGGGADPLERRKPIVAIKDEGMGMSEKADYVTIKGTVVYIKHDNECWYSACPTPGCNKKVVEGMGGQYMCEKCNQSFDTCLKRYVLSISMSDHTGTQWFSLFNDTAEKLLNATAQQLYEYRSNGEEARYEEVFSNALFKTVVCRVRVKQELMNDEMKVKCQFMKVEDLDLINECKQMIDAINKYN